MMLLLDLGNTRLKCASSDGERLGPSAALDHRDGDFEQQLTTLLARMPRANTVLFASVVGGDHGIGIEERLMQRLGPIQRIGPPHALPSLRLAYAEPHTLGVDRWLGLLGALGADCLVVSCGSALTIDLLDASGRHHGGLIAPSPERMREALLARAPHLASAPGHVVDFADNTADAMASGAVLAAVALIERQARLGAQRLGTMPRVLLTGGGSETLAPHVQLPFEMREQLVFEGMLHWARLHGDG